MNIQTTKTNNNNKGFGKTKLKINKIPKHLNIGGIGQTTVHPQPKKY